MCTVRLKSTLSRGSAGLEPILKSFPTRREHQNSIQQRQDVGFSMAQILVPWLELRPQSTLAENSAH
jgi:hypothetical protein